MVDDYTIEIMRSTNNAVQTARVMNTSKDSKTTEDSEQSGNLQDI